MKLLEYEAKRILRDFNIPVPEGKLITADNMPTINTPVVLKSQVPAGGRGKAGGIVVIGDGKNDQIKPAIDRLFSLRIKGYLPKTILAEDFLIIENELYLSVMIDRSSSSIVLMAHKNGGVEVEENTADSFFTRELTGNNSESIGELLAEYYSLESKSFVLQDLVENLYQCFVKSDATLIEINPLVVDRRGELVAGDCKMELNDAASFRHPNWSFEATAAEVNFVELNRNGNIATIANGAGLAMATVDAVADAGLQPANFLDIGGGANEASVGAAFERIMTYPNIGAIVINIFAGITRCDEVARAIVAAHSQIKNLPPLCIRLSGTNYQAAVDILEQHDITILPTLTECIAAAEKEVKSI